MNKLCLGLAMVLLMPFAYAQNSMNDDFKKHEIGIQINQLVNQVLSLGNSPEVDNPYLLRYAYHLDKKHALNLGFGLELVGVDEKEGGNVSRSLLDLRVGYMRYFEVANNLDLGIGADLVLQRHITRSQLIQTGGFSDSTVINTNAINNLLGGGLRANITYNITPVISVGTEANMYYLTGLDKTELTVSNYDSFSGELRSFSENTDEATVTRMQMQMPVVLFFILRL